MINRLKFALLSLAIFATILATPAVATAAVNQPLEIINRPRTLPGSELELDAGADVTRVSTTFGTSTSSQTLVGLPLGIGYGVSNDLDLHVFYTPALRPTFTGKTPLDVRLGYTVLRQGKLTAAVRVMSGIDLGNNTATPLRLGANVQYNVTDTFALFTPGEQLTIGLSGSSRPIHLDLPVGVGLQASPRAYFALTTNLARIKIANDSDALILRDMIPVVLQGFYSITQALDLGAHFDIDLKFTDVFTVGVFVRAFM